MFQILHLLGKQFYKFKLLKKQKIFNVFYVSLLKQNIIINQQLDKNNIKVNVGKKNKEYKFKTI